MFQQGMPVSVIDDFLAHLALTDLGDDQFSGFSQHCAATGHLFGGQIMAQAFSAASQTVSRPRLGHQLSGQFLRQGSTESPVYFRVERVKEGRSFSHRRVSASQDHRCLFTMDATFQEDEEGLDHGECLPVVADPQSLPRLEDFDAEFVGSGPRQLFDFLATHSVLEYRFEAPPAYLEHRDRPARQRTWVRAKYPLPEDPALQRALLVYASDHNFLRTALLPYRSRVGTEAFQFASLNHSLWIHRQVNLSDWLRYEVVSPVACHHRTLVTGHFYDRAGRLVATAVQEGLMRLAGEGGLASEVV